MVILRNAVVEMAWMEYVLLVYEAVAECNVMGLEERECCHGSYVVEWWCVSEGAIHPYILKQQSIEACEQQHTRKVEHCGELCIILHGTCTDSFSLKQMPYAFRYSKYCGLSCRIG